MDYRDSSAPRGVRQIAPRPGYQGGRKPPQGPKGHDAVLKSIQDDKRPITVTLLSGETLVGTLVARDKFTLSIDSANGVFVVYKHAIEMFTAKPKDAQ